MTSSGGMLPRLTSGPNWRMNQACCDFCGASKSSRSTGQLVDDLVDQAAAHLAAAAEDARGARLARLRDDLPGAGGELLADPLDPLVGREDRLGVLGADLREHAEILRQRLDDLELALARQVDRAVGDLDALEAVVAQPAAVAVELAAHLGDLEQRAAADHGDAERAVERELLAQVLRHVRRAPAELDDVDVVAAGRHQALDLRQGQALVHDVRDADLARLGGPEREVEKAVDAVCDAHRGRGYQSLLIARRRDASSACRHAATAAAAWPARQPKTEPSSSELPIMRLRPCTPPVISPAA